MAEYISKQRAKDLMGCCLASAKAKFKSETSVIRKVQLYGWDSVDDSVEPCHNWRYTNEAEKLIGDEPNGI